MAFLGDPEAATYLRSAAKPFQCLPLLLAGGEARFGLTPADLALICASHSGDPEHKRGRGTSSPGAGSASATCSAAPTPPGEGERAADAPRGGRAHAAAQQLLGQARGHAPGLQAARAPHRGLRRPGPSAPAAHPGARAGDLPRAPRAGRGSGSTAAACPPSTCRSRPRPGATPPWPIPAAAGLHGGRGGGAGAGRRGP